MATFKVKVHTTFFDGTRRIRPGEVVTVDRDKPPSWGTVIDEPKPEPVPPATEEEASAPEKHSGRHFKK